MPATSRKAASFTKYWPPSRRGTSDTSRIATDHINNPNAINPIFLLAERERIAVPEKMAGGTLALPGEKEEMPVPHILKDGADSIGVPGATIRVYVNIGMFSEYWLTRHNRLDRTDAAEAVRNCRMRESIPSFGARPKNGWPTSRRSFES